MRYRFGFRFLVFLGFVAALPAAAPGQFQRPWKVYFAPFSHVDVGYTGSVADVLAAQQRFLDTVIVYCQRTASLPEGERYAWTVEETWPLEAYVQNRSSGRVDTLMSLVREGRIEVGAMHVSLQTDLCGNEELVRSLSVAHELSQAYSFPVTTAIINDTPGFTWGLSEVLSKAGLPYLSVAMNNFLSNFYTTTTLPYLFYWEGESGARTLVWRCIDKQWAYLEGFITLGVYSGYPVFKQRLTEFLNRLEAEKYPYNEVFVNAGTGDNGPPNFAIVGNVQQWNSEYPATPAVISTMKQFFDTVATKYAGAIPAYRGDAPNWWSWTFASSATKGVAHSREAQRFIPEAEAWGTVARVYDPSYVYPAQELSDAYIDNLFFEDHNLGALSAAGNVPFWNLKMGWVDSARQVGARERDRAISRLAGGISTQASPAIAVFNGLLHPRSGVVVASLSEPAFPAGPFDLVDDLTGGIVPTQVLSDGTLAFVADSVPAMGYRLFRLVPNSSKPWAPGVLATAAAENTHYRVVANQANGSITQLLDKTAAVDLTAGVAGFNLYRYNSTQLPSGLTIQATDSGAVLQRFVLGGTAPGTSRYQTTVTLYAHEKAIRLDNRYTKNVPSALESVDFLFGTSLPSPQVTYDGPFSVVRLYTDELSGFRVNHYSARRWINVRSGADNLNVTLAPIAAPLHAYPPAGFDGTIRALISFNDANSAYRAGTGDLTMSYVVTSAPQPFRAEVSSRFGEEAASPFIIRIIPPGQSGDLRVASGQSAVRVAPSWIVTSTLKQGAGQSAVVRLFNPTDAVVSCTLSTTLGFQGAPEVTDIFEVPSGLVSVSGNDALFTMNPYEVKTIRFNPVPVTGVDEDLSAPAEFALWQNYPNPFNPTTEIRYQVSGVSTVKLVVYDVLGREVSTLVDEQKSPGRHEVSFNASGFPTGVYICRLTAGDRSASRKMILLK